MASKFAKFMKSNKAVKENGTYAPTKSLCDEDGSPLEWEFRHITSKENAALQDACTAEVPIPGKPNLYRPRVKGNEYVQKMIIASTVVPDLYDTELQDSYGVKTPEDLLYALIDDPGEYSDLAAFVQKFQGFNTSFDEKTEEAKN